MSLDKIREAVLKVSRAEAEHINTAAEKEATKNMETRKESLRREFTYQFQTRSRLIEEEYSRKVARQRGSAAKDILEAKNAAITAVFKKASDIILAWSPDEYRHFVQRLLERITAGRGGRVRVHPEDREIFKRIVTTMNANRPKAAALAIDDASLGEKGGFVFIGDGFEIDATVRTILGGIEQELLPDIARDLANI